MAFLLLRNLIQDDDGNANAHNARRKHIYFTI